MALALRGEVKLFPSVQKRLGTMHRVAPKIARGMREGRGGIADQFRRQGTLSGQGNFTPWKPSQRALREGGPTMIDTDDYRQKWLGRGYGSVTGINSNAGGVRVTVGINPDLDPRVLVFQQETSRGPVAPRPVSTNSTMTDVAGQAGLDYLTRGVT